MKYMGSKSKIAKYIVPILQSFILLHRIENYVEPFCGGCNIIDKINCKNKIAGDKQHYLIELYKNLDKLHKLPEFVTKEHYSEVRNCYNSKDNTFPHWYVGAVGFLASYNGRFFDGGYAGLVTTKEGNIRNYYNEAKKNLLAQDLTGIKFVESDYRDLEIPENSLIYCDPPYKGTKQYGINKKFNYDEFWEWVRQKSKTNIVVVSEQSTPEDFYTIWNMPIKRTIDNKKRIIAIEKLVTLNEVR